MRDVFAWWPVRIRHPIYLSPTGRWAWLRRVRRITRRAPMAVAYIDIPPAAI